MQTNGSIQQNYGPSAIATPANALTLFRLAATPVFLVILLTTKVGWIPLFIWFVLTSTDGVDGWIARKQGTTRSGAFLDPLADKFLVLGAFGALAVTGVFSFLPVIITGARELFMSLYRSYKSRQGVSIPAGSIAKMKTFTQDIAVAIAISPIGETFRAISVVVLWISVILGVVSFLIYLSVFL